MKIDAYSCSCHDWLINELWHLKEVQYFDFCPYCGKRLMLHPNIVKRQQK